MDPDEIQRAILRDVHNRVSRGEHTEANPAYCAKGLGITEIEARRNLKHLIETGALDRTVRDVIGGSYFFVEDITANGERLMKQQQAIQPAVPVTAAPKADLESVKTPTYLRALALLAMRVVDLTGDTRTEGKSSSSIPRSLK